MAFGDLWVFFGFFFLVFGIWLRRLGRTFTIFVASPSSSHSAWSNLEYPVLPLCILLLTYSFQWKIWG